MLEFMNLYKRFRYLDILYELIRIQSQVKFKVI
jgi:hypothetical protein